MKKKSFYIVLCLFLFISLTNAQEGFRMEVCIGPSIGDSREYFSYSLQGNFYYLQNVTKNIDVGTTTGALVFLGEGDNINGANNIFGSIPDVFIPIAIASRINILKKTSIGTDIGYGISVNGNDGGFYLRPIITYNLKDKIAFVGSYANINEFEGNASTINFGINFGF